MHHSSLTVSTTQPEVSQGAASDTRWSYGRSSGKRLASGASCMDTGASTCSPGNDVMDCRGYLAVSAVSAAPSLPLSVDGVSGVMMHAHGQSAATVAAACCCAAAANLKAEGPAVADIAPTPKRQRIRDLAVTHGCHPSSCEETSGEVPASEGISGGTGLAAKRSIRSSPLRAEMFLDFVDSSSLVMLPSREKAEALLQQHRQRLSATREQQRGGVCARLRPLERPPFAFVSTGCRNRSGSTLTSIVAERDSTKLKGIVNGELPLTEKTLTTLEVGLRARESLYRLRQQVLELPGPNRHGVALVYGAKMSADDGYDYRSALGICVDAVNSKVQN